jgi:hypothetical protein
MVAENLKYQHRYYHLASVAAGNSPQWAYGVLEATGSDDGTERRMHLFSWINELTERADTHGNADGIDLAMPDWFYRAVLDDALVLTIDPAYFGLTGGLERRLYRLVHKHAGHRRGRLAVRFSPSPRQVGEPFAIQALCVRVA